MRNFVQSVLENASITSKAAKWRAVFDECLRRGINDAQAQRRWALSMGIHANEGQLYNAWRGWAVQHDLAQPVQHREGSAASRTAAATTPTAAPRLREKTIGIELECFGAAYGEVVAAVQSVGEKCYSVHYDHRDSHDEWKVMYDGSLSALDKPFELVSPILRGEEGLRRIEKVCLALESIGVKIANDCGFHVHVGAADLSEQAYVDTFYNYAKAENVIEQCLPPHRRTSRWCKKVSTLLSRLRTATTRGEVRSMCHHDRYYSVNAVAYEGERNHAGHKTIEFRHHSGTINYQKISQWVRMCVKLVEYSEKEGKVSGDINTIADMPWLTPDGKVYFKMRAKFFAMRENRACDV